VSVLFGREASRTHLIHPQKEWKLEQLLARKKELMGIYVTSDPIAFNASALRLAAPMSVGEITDAQEVYQLDGSGVTLAQLSQQPHISPGR
jgi:DNA polymerase III alpha subunit